MEGVGVGEHHRAYRPDGEASASFTSSAPGFDTEESLSPSISNPALLHSVQLEMDHLSAESALQREVETLRIALDEAQRVEELRTQQEAVLKDEINRLRRASQRENLSPEYLKNVVYKYLTIIPDSTNQAEQKALVSVLSRVLQFTTEEEETALETLSHIHSLSGGIGADINSSLNLVSEGVRGVWSSFWSSSKSVSSTTPDAPTSH